MNIVNLKTKEPQNSTKRIFRILPNFDSSCSNCSLSCDGALSGHSFSQLKDVELLIISSFPTREESKQGLFFTPNIRSPKLDRPNSGRFLEYSTIYHFDRDELFPSELKPFYNKIAFTNIIKCTPFDFRGNKTLIKDSHIKSCKTSWLEKEIAILSNFNPTMPILLCGSDAAKLLGPKQSLYSSRRQIFKYKNTHSTIVTFNPCDIVKYISNNIVKSRVNTKGFHIVESIQPAKPIIIGSPTWHWNQDMKLIKNIIVENYNKKMEINNESC